MDKIPVSIQIGEKMASSIDPNSALLLAIGHLGFDTNFYYTNGEWNKPPNEYFGPALEPMTQIGTALALDKQPRADDYALVAGIIPEVKRTASHLFGGTTDPIVTVYRYLPPPKTEPDNVKEVQKRKYNDRRRVTRGEGRYSRRKKISP